MSTKAKSKAASPAQGAPNLNHPTYFLNRELSWLEFNRRVLEEALDSLHPLLERVKFLSIFHSNLDEFFMIRVSGLRRQLAVGALKAPPDGMSPAQQLAAIRERLTPMLQEAGRCWREELKPGLDAAKIRVTPYDQLKRKQRRILSRHFAREIFPALTPLAFDPGHPFPHISNLSINLAVVVKDPGFGERFARVKVPHGLSRILRVPTEDEVGDDPRLGLVDPQSNHLVFLEEVVAANLDLLFPGLEVVASYPFRVTRDADVEIEEDEAADLLTTMEEMVGQRHFGSAVRLEVDARMPPSIREILTGNLGLAPYQVWEVESPMGSSDLMQLIRLERPDLKDPPLAPIQHRRLAPDKSAFSVVRRRDILLYHPYDSFTTVVDFLREAAKDPKVVAIKQTLYRVGPNSPVVEALMEARENGKQVSVLVELKARFDETNNIVWARALERAGVHVVYGLVGLKVHAKMCLVVRREAEGLAGYVHLGTGNYNPITARIYTDIGLMSADPDLTADVSDLFNALTGYSRKDEYRKILVAPGRMSRQILARIRREIEAHERQGGGAHWLQDELARGQGLHQGSVPGLPGRCAGRPAGAGDLLPAAGRPPGQREHPGHLHRRPVPRAQPHLLLPERRRGGDPPGQRRPHAAQPARSGRTALPRSGSPPPGVGSRGDPGSSLRRRRPVPRASAGWQLPAPGAAGRDRPRLPGREAAAEGSLAWRGVSGSATS